jgi:hypothetical protein
MGYDEILKLSSSKALMLMMGEAEWVTLSHENAHTPLGELFACYSHHMPELKEEEKAALREITHAFWISFPQYQAYLTQVPELARAQHFCGLGKTYLAFKQQQIPVTPVMDRHEFLTLLGLV